MKFQIKIYNPIKEYKEYKRKERYARSLMDMYHKICSQVLEYMKEDRSNYDEYWKRYNEFSILWEIYFSAHRSLGMSLSEEIRRLESIVEKGKSLFPKIPVVKAMNREENLEILINE